MQKVRGVIAHKKGEPVSVETVMVPDPGPGEAVVAVQACGVCRTDLHYRDGGITDAFPFLLGHEAAGVVEAVGEGVTDVAPGDFVVLNWRAVDGTCRACRRGEPWYCFSTHNAARKMTLESGQELSAALGIGAFVEKTLVHAGQCTKVNPAVRPEVAGLLGCGIMAGIGAAINTGGVRRGDSVAVIGCGGVGDAAIAGAKLAGATTIVAIDIDDTKLEWAREFGATHTINARQTDVVAGVQALTDGNGARVVIDAVGRPETFTQAFYARDLAGIAVLVGVPHPGHEDRTAADRRLRPRRGDQVVLVRRLPALPRLPDADRPAPAGPAAAGQIRVRDDLARRRRGGVPPHGARPGPAFGGTAVMAGKAMRQHPLEAPPRHRSSPPQQR
jgi:S-(hydroxymethyl)mycothiol dehydrogenase